MFKSSSTRSKPFQALLSASGFPQKQRRVLLFVSLFGSEGHACVRAQNLLYPQHATLAHARTTRAVAGFIQGARVTFIRGGRELRMHTCAHRSCKQFLKHGPPQKGANKPKLISWALGLGPEVIPHSHAPGWPKAFGQPPVRP